MNTNLEFVHHGYIYNLHNAYKVAQREGVPLKSIAPAALETAFSCFIYYNVALAKEVPKETLSAIEELSRKFYYDYYKQMYTNSYNSKGSHLQGIIFKQTLDDFIDLMFSKEVDTTTYEQLEASVQTVAENL